MNRMSLFSEAHICEVCKNLFSPTRKECHISIYQYIFYTEWGKRWYSNSALFCVQDPDPLGCSEGLSKAIFSSQSLSSWRGGYSRRHNAIVDYIPQSENLASGSLVSDPSLPTSCGCGIMIVASTRKELRAESKEKCYWVAWYTGCEGYCRPFFKMVSCINR